MGWVAPSRSKLPLPRGDWGNLDPIEQMVFRAHRSRPTQPKRNLNRFRARDRVRQTDRPTARQTDILAPTATIFSERHVHVRYMLSSVRLSVVCLSSVTLVRPTQVVQIFGNISTALGTLAIH